LSADFEFSPELSAAIQDVLTDEEIASVVRGDRIRLNPGQIAQIFQAGLDSRASAPPTATSDVPTDDVDVGDFTPPGYADKLVTAMREWEPAPEPKEPFDASLAPYQLTPIAMLRYVLPYIVSRAVDPELSRTRAVSDCYINTITRRYIERAEAGRGGDGSALAVADTAGG
jgi:hypothetical protein